MEETMRRTAPRRSTVSHRRKSKPIYNYKIIRKIIIQLIISGLILICILSFKNINSPFAKQVSTGLDRFISSNLDYSQAYKSVSDFAAKTGSMLKGFFYPASKKQAIPNSDTSRVTNKDIPAEQEQSSEGKNKSNSEGASVNKSHIAAPVTSSINSIDPYVKSIKSNYKIALPLNGPVSSKFGLRINPITKKDEFHPGIDIKANMGTPIYAAISGEVIEARKGTTFGNFIKIQSGKDIITVYAHCNRLVVKKGQKVRLGQKIAEVGNTGMSLGAHLHFEVWKSGILIDPSYLYSQYASK